MRNNIPQQEVIKPKFGLLDMLDEKSLAVMKKFGHVYEDRYTGKTKIRVFKNK